MTDSKTGGNEQELTRELGKIERHLHRLRKRRKEVLDELGESDRNV